MYVASLHYIAGLDIETKSERIANFHAATVNAALEIVGALGVQCPADVRPQHLYRRDSGIHTRDFARLHDELFPALSSPGLLLKSPADAPPQLRVWWEAGGELHRASRHRTGA